MVWNIDAVDGNIFNCIKMVFTGLARQSSIGKFAYNGVDDSLNLLSRFVIVLLLGLMFMSLLVIPLSPSIFCYVPPSIDIISSMMVLLVASGSCFCWVFKPLHNLG